MTDDTLQYLFVAIVVVTLFFAGLKGYDHGRSL